MPKFYLDTEEKGKGYIVGWMGRLQKTRDGQNNRKGAPAGSWAGGPEGDDFSFAANGAVVQPSILQVQKPSDRLGDFTVDRDSNATHVDSDGIIKEAILLGDELVTNGDFEDGSTGWVLDEPATMSIMDGEAVFESTTAAMRLRQNSIAEIIIGKMYRIEYTVSDYVEGGIFMEQPFLTSGDISESNGTYSFVGEATNNNLRLRTDIGLNTYKIDNVSVKKVSYDMARIDYTNGVAELLTEPQSTNLYLQSGGSGVENTTVTATPYTVSFYGTGTLTFSGAYIGSLIGTGENERVSLTFTPTAGTLTSATSGTITYKQCENLAYATSVIITNGSTVTRLQDVITDGGNVNVINSEEGTMFFEGSLLDNDGTNTRYITINDGSVTNRIAFNFGATNTTLQVTSYVGGVLNTNIFANGIDQLKNSKYAIKWKLNDWAVWVDGVEKGTDLTGLSYPIDTLNNIDFREANSTSYPFFGKTRALKVYDRALTDEELQAITEL